MKYGTVLFDLDGTLLDTNELILSSFDHALGAHAPGRYTRADVIPLMGKPLVTQMKLLLPGQEEEAIKTYRAFNFEKHDELVTSFANAMPALQSLRDAGVKLGVVTSKIRKTTEMGLVLTGLRSFFEVIITSEDVEKPKPDGEPVCAAMKLLGANPAGTLMVGDSPFDLLAGQAAGTKTVAVGWSMFGEEGLAPYRPDYWVHDLRDLLGIVTRG